MTLFSFQPSFLNVDRHWKTQVGHGLIALTVGLAGDVFGLWSGRAAVSAAFAFYLAREIGAHRFYAARRATMTAREYRKARWDSKLDVAWPALAVFVVWTIPYAGTVWPWWLGGVFALIAITRGTDPGGQYSGME